MPINPSTVVSLNNRGVSLLLQSDFSPAIDALLESLQASRAMLEECPLPCEGDRSAPRSFLSIDRWMKEATVDQEGDEFSFFYDHPIVVPFPPIVEYPQPQDESMQPLAQRQETQAMDTEDEIEGFLRLSVLATTFNLAIAFQGLAQTRRQANPAQAKEEAALKKSLQLFQYSDQLCKETTQDQGCTLFTLASLNNVALLHEYLGQRDMAKDYFQGLLAALMFLVTRNVGTDDMSISQSFAAFFQNTSHLSYPECSVCAGSA